MIVWHEPTDPQPRRSDRAALAFAIVVVLAASHGWAYAEGYLRPLELATDAYERETHAYDLLARAVGQAERTLPVCLSADERMHGLLEDHATWRVDEP